MGKDTNNFEAFLKELAKQKRTLCNYEAFKIRINLSPETYSFLTKAENFKDFIGALASIAAGGSAGTFVWWTSASAFTKSPPESSLL
jgi:hypothetical protein